MQKLPIKFNQNANFYFLGNYFLLVKYEQLIFQSSNLNLLWQKSLSVLVEHHNNLNSSLWLFWPTQVLNNGAFITFKIIPKRVFSVMYLEWIHQWVKLWSSYTREHCAQKEKETIASHSSSNSFMFSISFFLFL